MIRRPAIVLSCHTIGLGVIRSLGVMGVPVVAVTYNNSDMGHVSNYVAEKYFIPDPEKNEEEFIESLVACGKRYPNSLLIPADDATVVPVSRHIKLLSEYFIVGCTDLRTTELFIDKSLTYALGEKIGVAVPKTLVPMSIEDLEMYSNDIDFPCLIKPRIGHRYFEIFKKKMTIVSNFDQMAYAYRQAVGAGIDVLMQELIPGDDTQGVNYNSYFLDGRPLVEFTAEKVRLSPPRFGIPRVVVSKDIPEVVEPARKLLRAMGFYGYSCTEFKKDARDGKYVLMEVNGRHNRSSLLSLACGINFPWLQYKHLVEGELPQQTQSKSGVYWIDEFKDIEGITRSIRENSVSLVSYFSPYFKEHVFSVFDYRDMKPFLKRCGDVVQTGYRGLVGKGRY